MNYLREQKHIKVFFVVGRVSGDKADQIQAMIQEEHETYGDILQVDYFEHANNNTLKTLHTFKYILNIDWNGLYPDFVMKTDDDIYINLPLLDELIFSDPDLIKKAGGRLPMMGFLLIENPVLEILVIQCGYISFVGGSTTSGDSLFHLTCYETFNEEHGKTNHSSWLSGTI